MKSSIWIVDFGSQYTQLITRKFRELGFTSEIMTVETAMERLNKEGLQHHGVYFSFDGERIRVPFNELTGGRRITIYGQQEVVKDLIKTNLAICILKIG